MPTFVSCGFFYQKKDLHPPYPKQEELTRHFLTWCTYRRRLMLHKIVIRITITFRSGVNDRKYGFLGEEARCLSKVANSSGFMFTQFYCRHFKNIKQVTVCRIPNIDKRFFKGTSNSYNNLNVDFFADNRLSTLSLFSKL